MTDGTPVLVTAPTGEPLSVQEAKDWMRVTTNDDPRIIGNLITSARREVERITGRSLITQTWDLFLDKFPCVGWNQALYQFTARMIRVPLPPLQSVTTVKYLDTDGVQQTLASTEYTVDIKNEPGRIVEAYGKSWPATRYQVNAVEVRFVAGYGNASTVPEELKTAMLELIAHNYENREAVLVGAGNMAMAVPFGFESKISTYRTDLV